MYTAHVDVEGQSFRIEDSSGTVVAYRPMLTQHWPNPGRDALMARPENLKSWQMIKDLAEAANRGYVSSG